MKKKITKLEKLQKKQDNLVFWRKGFIFPIFGTAVCTFSATIISLIISLFTMNFIPTGILAVLTLISSATTIADYKLYDFIDAKFYEKILKIKSQIKELTKEAEVEKTEEFVSEQVSKEFVCKSSKVEKTIQNENNNESTI